MLWNRSTIEKVKELKIGGRRSWFLHQRSSVTRVKPFLFRSFNQTIQIKVFWRLKGALLNMFFFNATGLVTVCCDQIKSNTSVYNTYRMRKIQSNFATAIKCIDLTNYKNPHFVHATHHFTFKTPCISWCGFAITEIILLTRGTKQKLTTISKINIHVYHITTVRDKSKVHIQEYAKQHFKII